MASNIKECPPGFVDLVYKEEAGVSVPLRLWPAGIGAKNAPWLFWIHGGAWLAGKHYRPNYWINPAFTSRGYHVVSVAYRLMPQVSIDDSIQDLKDALAWCRAQLPILLGHNAIDVDAYVVGGDSAGGSFSTQAGHVFRPRPRVVIDLYGVTDFSDTYYNSEVVPDDTGYNFPLVKVKEAAEDRDPRNALVTAAFPDEWPPHVSHETLAKTWGTPYKTGEVDMLRADVNRYISSRHWLFKVGFRRGEHESEDAWMERLRSVSSLHMLNEAKGYPPTAILQGTADTAVPEDQSLRFEARLKELKVPVFSRYVKDAEHEFEGGVTEPTDPLWKECIAPLMDFVDEHANAPKSDFSGKVTSVVQWSYE